MRDVFSVEGSFKLRPEELARKTSIPGRGKSPAEGPEPGNGLACSEELREPQCGWSMGH